jgi:hypothetical protein
MAPENAHRPTLAPAVATLLGSLRSRIRQYIWLEGCAAAVAWLGAAFWITLAGDWFFEPSAAVRIVMLAVVAAIFVAVVGRLIGRRAFVPITDSNAATVLERRFPHLNDALLTAVVLSSDAAATSDAADPDREMLALTCREAEQRIRQVELHRVFNPRPLWLHCSAATLLTISVVIFAVLFFDAFGLWARRTLAMSSDVWPRSTKLEVVGFEAGVPRKVARGSDLEVIVRADTSKPLVPEVVEVRYRIEGGGRGRATMDRRGTAEFAYTFRSVLADVHFDVVGGDARVDDCRIKAVDSPTISRMTLDCKLPAYIGRKQPPMPVTGVMQIPAGSRVTVHADQANKDIVAVQVNSVVGDRPGPSKSLYEQDLAADRRGFSYSLPPLVADTTLLFTLTDTDGLQSREPVRVMLVPTPDQPPQMSVQLDGIGTAITPQARVAVAGRISDDYGIGRVWFERAVDQQEPRSREIAQLPKAPDVYNLVDQAFEVRDLSLKPGQKLLICVKAADLCNLGHGPNVSTSERWMLDVVTPEQLRAILEARELVLRQRFEQLLQEMTETRDLLSRMQFEPGKADSPRPGPLPKGEGTAAAKPAATAKQTAGEEEPADSPERLRNLRFLRVQSALTNCRKGAPEIASVAESFDDICKQLVNNRIDTEELKKRLNGGIAEPLHQIAGKMFPELDRRLDELQSGLEDLRRAPALRDAAQQHAESILLAMRKVRDRMIELEDFNEAVELLRSIVDTQKKLHEETEQRHKEKIRSLLKE